MLDEPLPATLRRGVLDTPQPEHVGGIDHADHTCVRHVLPMEC